MAASMSIEVLREAGSAAAPATAAFGRVFSPDLVVLRLERENGPYRHLELVSVLPVVRRWREAIISRSNDLPDGVRGLVSGHQAGGSRLDGPHLAFVPLVPIRHRREGGRLYGMGLTLPADTPAVERGLALRDNVEPVTECRQLCQIKRGMNDGR